MLTSIRNLGIALAALTLSGCFGQSAQKSFLPSYTPPDPPPLPGHKPQPPAYRPAAVPEVWSSNAPRSQTAARQAVVTQPLAAVAEAPPSGALVHVVVSGDTLSALAHHYRLSLKNLATANNLKPPYALKVGQKLKIPGERRHRVVAGDTVYRLSLAYDTDLISLVQLNRLAPPYKVVPGQILLIPDKHQVTGGHLVAEAPGSASSGATAGGKLPDPPPLTGGKFIWPVSGRVILGFGPKSGGQQNDGINIAAPRGSPVRAAENGVVAYSGNELRGFGNLVLIKHRDGWTTAYAHVDQLLVRRGEQVKRGQLIGRVGSTGSVARPQLHFEVRKGARAVDPVTMLERETATKAAAGATKG